MVKLTCKKIREMIKDEEKGGREYYKYGLIKLGNDEYKHSKHLKGKLISMKC